MPLNTRHLKQAGQRGRCLARTRRTTPWVFRDLTENQLRRGIFKNLEQLIIAIGNYIDQHNQNPKPFIWTAKASDILQKVTRAQASLDKRLSV
jgi:hypothetical protein